MSYRIKTKKIIDKNKAKLELEISNSYYKKQIGNAYREISKKANIPGFRKGKIPYQVIDSNFGKPYVLQEAASRSIAELYPDIIEESGYQPIDYPKINIIQMEEDKPLGFEAEIELEPDIVLPKYRGIKVNAFPAGVGDDELQQQIDNIRKNFASLEPVDDDRPADGGDFVTIDFIGKIEGKEFEGGSAQDYSLELGSKTFFPEFETSIIGMKKGGKKQVSLLLPENIEKRDIAGKKADFEVSLKEIKRRVLPELDEKFLKDLGEYESVEDFKNQFRQRLEEQKKNQRQSLVIGQIVEHIAKNIKDEIPLPMIEKRIERIEKEIEEGLKKQKMKKEDYLKALNITEEKFNLQIRERAEKEVREYLIFIALEKSEASNIKPTNEEIAKEKQDILSRYDKDEEKKKISEYFEKPEAELQISATVKRRKLLKQLERNVIVIEEVPKADNIDDKNKIWTPEDDKDEKRKEALWTPDTKGLKNEDKIEGDDKNE
ncbi:MAG: trigger factor [Actinobacteria bacterium]|nr:trigger factor [Actinomycetota bacterium]